MSLRHLLAALAVAFSGFTCVHSQELPTSESIVTGTESVAWEQPAASLRDLRALNYLAYVDGVRVPLEAVSCGTTATVFGFHCVSPLPPLSPGRHVIEFAAIVSYGDIQLESDRASLSVVMVGGSQTLSPTSGRPARRETQVGLPIASRTKDGVAFSVETFAGNLDAPVAMTFTSDGLLFVIERNRRIRVLGSPYPVVEPALTLSDALERGERGSLVDLAVSPDFTRTHHVFVLAIVQVPGAEPVYRLARFRELNGILTERVVLLDGVPVSPSARAGAIVRCGPDGRLYAGFRDLTDRPVAQDLATLNGKILRLDEDGGVPRDNPRPSPVFSYGHGAPVGLAWDPASGALWETERGINGGDRLNLVLANRDYGWPDTRLASTDALKMSVALGDSIDPIGAAFYSGRQIAQFHGDLFFVSRARRALYRVRFDVADRRRVLFIEPLLENRLGELGGVVSGPDGAVYVFTANQGAAGDAGVGGDSVLRIAPTS